MKSCPVCRQDLDDAYLFCPEDGTTLSGYGEKVTTSVLEDPARDKSDIGEPDLRNPVVLYCPKCAAEYPLTFIACPVHGDALTRHSVPRIIEPAAVASPGSSANAEPSPVTPLVEAEPQTTDSVQTEAVADQTAVSNSTEAYIAAPAAIETDEAATEPVNADPKSNQPRAEVPFGGFQSFERNPTFERPGFRMAATGTIVALSILALLGLYAVGSNFAKRRAATNRPNSAAVETTTSPVVVQTPIEAQNYREEPPASTEVTPPQHSDEPAEPPRLVKQENESHKSTSRPETVVTQVRTPNASTLPQPVVAQTPRPAIPPPPQIPLGDTGFDSRLIRVRSNRTGSGVRYDLTFNMHEQGGRAAHWQRILISTHSTSGLSRSQAIPFVHRLGPDGALTFTISVEMPGRSEADWQGRIICTTLGWDNNDRPLQTVFGTTVTP